MKFPPTLDTEFWMWLRAAQPPPSAGGMAVAQPPLLGHCTVLWPRKAFQMESNSLGSESSLLELPEMRQGIPPAHMCQESGEVGRMPHQHLSPGNEAREPPSNDLTAPFPQAGPPELAGRRLGTDLSVCGPGCGPGHGHCSRTHWVT